MYETSKYQSSTQSISGTLATNKVLRNTYVLLSMTLLFSAIAAGVSMAIGLSSIASMGCSLGALALIWFVIPRTQHTSAGIIWVFAMTGLLGAGLGPMLSHFLSTPAGASIVMQALAGTGLIFVGMSGYAMVTKRDFSFMGGFLFAGILIAFFAGIANIFLQIPALHLVVSIMFAGISSLLILFETNRIVRGGETNYISATVSLYVSIYNLFVSLMSILGVMSGDD